MVFDYAYCQTIENFNKDGRISLPGVLKLFENTASAHADYAKEGVYSNRPKDFAWVLTDWFIEIESRPHFTDRIKAKTWAEFLESPLLVTRNFILCANEEDCIKGCSKWIMLDLEKNRPRKIDEEKNLYKYMPEYKTIYGNKKLCKIPEPEKYDIEKEIELRRSDFDFNNHVHNTVYLDLAFETMPQEVIENTEFKSLRISYKSAFVKQEKIVCKYAKVDDSYIIGVYDKENILHTLIMLK